IYLFVWHKRRWKASYENSALRFPGHAMNIIAPLLGLTIRIVVTREVSAIPMPTRNNDLGADAAIKVVNWEFFGRKVQFTQPFLIIQEVIIKHAEIGKESN